MIPLGIVCLALIGYIIWRELQHSKERQEVVGFAERIAEREAKARADLIAQVQQPELSPTFALPEPTGETLYVPEDDDSAHDDYVRARQAGDLA